MNNDEEIVTDHGNYRSKDTDWQEIYINFDQIASSAHAINNMGQVVVEYQRCGEYDCDERKLYLWHRSGSVEKIDSDLGYPVAINDCGLILFRRTYFGEIEYKGKNFFIWDDGKIISPFEDLPNKYSIIPVAINLSGDVVTYIKHDIGKKNEDFHFARIYTRDNEEIDIRANPGFSLDPNYMNNVREIVGNVRPHKSDLDNNKLARAFIWDSVNGVQDLNCLINPSSGWTLLNALLINNNGQIVGEGLKNGKPSIFLLTPITK
jgi:hypothetical protein